MAVVEQRTCLLPFIYLSVFVRTLPFQLNSKLWCTAGKQMHGGFNFLVTYSVVFAGNFGFVLLYIFKLDK